MVNHKYSTYILIGILCMVTIVFLVSAVTSEELDILCDTENSLLKRTTEGWACQKTSFGELYIENETTINIANDMTYYKITGFTLGHGQYIISDEDSNFYIRREGYYHITSSTSFSGGGNTEYEMELFINGLENPNCELHRRMGSGGDVGSASINCIDYLEEGDLIDIRVADNTNPSQDITIHAMNFNIMEVQ